MIQNLLFLSFLIPLVIGSPIVNSEAEVKPQDGDLFEGDIAGIDPTSKGAFDKTASLWPNGRVPYYVSTTFTDVHIEIIEEGLRHIEIKTSNKGNQTIKFIRVPTYEALSRYSNAINVIRGSGCYSYVGMQRTMNPQELSLGLGCVNVGTVIHEFMHALGFWHEQSRPDRDKYLTIYMSNVKTGMESNFYKFPTSQIGMTDLSYDYDSVMHYDKYAFSKNGKPTMEPKKKNVEIGNKQALSSTDVREIQRAYGNSAQRMSPLIGLAIFSMIINRIFQNFNF